MSNVERFYPIIQFLPLGFTIFNGLLHASRHLFRNQVRLKGNDEDDSIWGNIFKPFIEIKDIYEFIGDQNPEMDILQASTSKEKRIGVIRPLLIGFIFGLNGFLCLDYGSASLLWAALDATDH